MPNLFVGVGLFVTFLGLVAALGAAAEAITQGAESSKAMKEPIQNLLKAASAKFYASFAGLGVSLLLNTMFR